MTQRKKKALVMKQEKVKHRKNIISSLLTDQVLPYFLSVYLVISLQVSPDDGGAGREIE